MANSANTRQNYTKDAVRTTRTVSSYGDNSNMYNSSEEVYSNGNQILNTDNVTKRVVQTDNVSSNRGNNISDTSGNDSVYTNELNEGAYGSRMRIIGNPDVVNKELHKDADKLKAEIVAARSGFNDDRNDSDWNVLDDLMSIPSKIFSAITCVDDDVAEGDDMPLPTSGNNLFLAMATDIAMEIANYTKRFAKISASSQMKKAELAVKNEVEKKAKQIEMIQNLPDSASKEKLLKAVQEGNLMALMANPSNEGKEKKSTYDKDEYEAKAAELIPQLIELEKQCC